MQLILGFFSQLFLSFYIFHSSHSPLHTLEYNVPEGLDQLPLFLPIFHQAVITFRGGWAPPSEVAHPIGPILSFLWAQLGMWLCPGRSLDLSRVILCFIILTVQLPSSFGGETALRRAPALQRGGKYFDRSAFATRGFPPAEMLHWIGASFVTVGPQLLLWYLVFRGQGGQKYAEQEIIIIIHLQWAELWQLSLNHRHAELNAILWERNHRKQQHFKTKLKVCKSFAVSKVYGDISMSKLTVLNKVMHQEDQWLDVSKRPIVKTG